MPLTLLRCLVPVFGIALCASCAHYKFGDRTFSSKSEALRASDEEFAATLASVAPTETPVGGRARVLIPTREGVADSGVWEGDAPSNDVTEYVVELETRQLETMAAAVDRRRIFTETTVERAQIIGEPEVSAARKGADFVLCYYQLSPTVYQWYLLDTASMARSEVPLDVTKPTGRDRVNAWLVALERTAHRLERQRGSHGS